METFQNQCKWAIPDANKDMTIFYHCISPIAIKIMEERKFEGCLCLGFIDICINNNKKKA